MLIEVELADRDYDARVVANYGSALQVLEGEPIDALITNIDLGETRSGFDVARESRARNPGVPVVYVTGGSAHRFAGEKVDGGVLMTKPYRAPELIGRVEDLLAAARRARAQRGRPSEEDVTAAT